MSTQCQNTMLGLQVRVERAPELKGSCLQCAVHVPLACGYGQCKLLVSRELASSKSGRAMAGQTNATSIHKRLQALRIHA